MPALCRIAERVIALGWSEEARKMQYPNIRFQYRRDIEKLCRKELTEQSEPFTFSQISFAC